jgi:hypothetical protein
VLADSAAHHASALHCAYLPEAAATGLTALLADTTPPVDWVATVVLSLGASFMNSSMPLDGVLNASSAARDSVWQAPEVAAVKLSTAKQHWLAGHAATHAADVVAEVCAV